MTQTQKIIIAGIGVAIVVAAVVFLISPEDDICQHRTIKFDWKDPSNPDVGEIYAYPEKADEIQECASVAFVNLTKKPIKIVFDKNTTKYISPFSELKTISLDQTGDSNEYAKAFPVTVKTDASNKTLDFNYHVEVDDVPQTEQSPRIRIGPKTVIRSQ